MASNWIVENMHYSVICSLVPHVRATVVLSTISEHVFIMCYHKGVAVKGFLILLVLHYSLAYNDELAMARSSKYYVQKFLKCHKEFADDEKSNQRKGLQCYKCKSQFLHFLRRCQIIFLRQYSSICSRLILLLKK
jgi:hypothetical protein